MPTLTGASFRNLVGHRVAAAVSGGADSVALAHWLRPHHDREPGRVLFAGLIHVNHRLRGAESDRDENFCRALADRLGVPIEVIEAPVATSPGRSPERAARVARYRAFTVAADRLAATRVATAHTADDQAETVLMRLLRGAGSRGVSGIRAERGLYVRPLLACRRSAVREWLESLGELYCEDSTNADRSILRNRLRHELLPIVEQLAPGGVAALARAAALAADDEDVLDGLAVESAAPIVLQSGIATAELDREGLRELAPAIARRVLRRVFEKVAPHAPWRADHFESVLRLAARRAGGGSLDLPGVRVERVSNVLRVRSGTSAPVVDFTYTLAYGGEVVVAEAGWRLTATDRDDASETGGEAYVVQVPARAFPLTVRNRRPGDRVALSGGTRKVQDLMVDAKIPRSERARVPLIVSANGQVLWVIGRPGAGLTVTGSDAGSMVTLKARKLELT